MPRTASLITLLFGVGCCLLSSSAAEARPIKKLEIAKAYSSWNQLERPLFEPDGVTPVAFEPLTESFDRDEPVFLPTYGRMKRGGLRARLAPELQPGALLTDLLRDEAEKMGLPLGDGGWRVGGTVSRIRMFNHTPSAWSMGVLLCYGFLELEMKVTSPSGEVTEETVRLHNYMVYSGAKLVRNCMGRQLIEGSQEILARLNRVYINAPHSEAVGDMIAALGRTGLDDQEDLIYPLGLSGSVEAVPLFLETLETHKNENLRSDVINALASIGDPGVVEPLLTRFRVEEEDPRWYILKALGYIGTKEALEGVRELGLEDEEEYNRSLSARILGQD